MLPDFETRLRAYAEVIVRVGLNLQAGQKLLLAEPYELQGVARSAEVIVAAVRAAAEAAGGAGCDVIWADGARVREFAAQADWRGWETLLAANARQMQAHLATGGAFLFLLGSQPRLLDGVAPAHAAELRRIAWTHFGPIAQQLTRGATNWTCAPAPSPAWAQAACADLPSEQRLAALWRAALAALRVPETAAAAADSIAEWTRHLVDLARRRDELDARRLQTLRFRGASTDLTLTLPRGHRWRTAQLETSAGLPFVANLPTEEIFTAPDRDSAAGVVRVARPVSYGGALIDGIELEFARGRVVRAAARTGEDLLRRLLDTDEGARRLGEVALVPAAPAWAQPPRLFCHPLLDENAGPHLALGEAYVFCHRPPVPPALNRSLIHVDLPIAAELTA